MLKKTILTSLLFGFASAVFATNPSHYGVTITKIEFYNSSISSWQTYIQGSYTIDAASVGGNQNAGSIPPSTPLIEGTYTKIRMTFNDSFVLNGTATFTPSIRLGSNNGTTYYCCTRAGATLAKASGTDVFAHTGTVSETSSCSAQTDTAPISTGANAPGLSANMQHIGTSLVITQDLNSGQQFAIQNGSDGHAPQYSFKFDVEGQIAALTGLTPDKNLALTCIIYPLPPTISFSKM